MKKYFFLSALMLLPLSLLGQESLGTRDVSDWAFFSGFGNRPHLKKMDDGQFLAYYRTSPNESGFTVFDRALNEISSIDLELTENNRVLFSGKAYANLMDFPYFYYRKDNHSAVILGSVENPDKDYEYIALTYSLEAGDLIQIDTLRQAKSDDCFIKFSANDDCFMIGEEVKKNRTSSEMHYDVFGQDCKKLYSVSRDLPNKMMGYSVLSDDGELILASKVEKNRNVEIKFSKFDRGGNLIGTASFSPPKTDIYDYWVNDFLFAASNEAYCVLTKVRNGMEGYAVLKLDFEKGSSQKITDMTFDKAELASIYSNADIRHSMIKAKKVKPLKSMDDFTLNAAYIDDNGIYLVLESYSRSKAVSKNQVVYTYTGEDIILVGLDLKGKEKWITPIKREASYRMNGMDFYTPGGSGVRVKSFEDDASINLIVPSLKNIYTTKIDKQSGQALVPTQLLPENTITNTNCSLWLNANEVVVTSMKGVYFVLSKNEIKLNSIRLAD